MQSGRNTKSPAPLARAKTPGDGDDDEECYMRIAQRLMEEDFQQLGLPSSRRSPGKVSRAKAKLPPSLVDVPGINHKDLKKGQKNYLHSIASTYNTSATGERLKQGYNKLLRHQYRSGLYKQQEYEAYISWIYGKHKKLYKDDPSIWRSPERNKSARFRRPGTAVLEHPPPVTKRPTRPKTAPQTGKNKRKISRQKKRKSKKSIRSRNSSEESDKSRSSSKESGRSKSASKESDSLRSSSKESDRARGSSKESDRSRSSSKESDRSRSSSKESDRSRSSSKESDRPRSSSKESDRPRSSSKESDRPRSSSKESDRSISRKESDISSFKSSSKKSDNSEKVQSSSKISSVSESSSKTSVRSGNSQTSTYETEDRSPSTLSLPNATSDNGSVGIFSVTSSSEYDDSDTDYTTDEDTITSSVH